MYWPTLSCLFLYSVGRITNSWKLSGLQFYQSNHTFNIWDQPHLYYSGLVIPGVEALVLCNHDKSFCFSSQTHTKKPLLWNWVCIFPSIVKEYWLKHPVIGYWQIFMKTYCSSSKVNFQLHKSSTCLKSWNIQSFYIHFWMMHSIALHIHFLDVWRILVDDIEAVSDYRYGLCINCLDSICRIHFCFKDGLYFYVAFFSNFLFHVGMLYSIAFTNAKLSTDFFLFYFFYFCAVIWLYWCWFFKSSFSECCFRTFF